MGDLKKILIIFRWIAVVLLLFTSPSVWAFFGSVSSNDTLGRITAPTNASESFQTDLFTGSASTSIPIVVPPGTHGVQPGLAIVYNSASRSDDVSIIGAGWDLAGLGYIERSTKLGVPKYNSSDTYVLMMNGGSYDLVYASDGYYHTKLETFLRIQYIQNSNSWLAIDKAGTQYQFGVNTDSRAEASGRNAIQRWSLDQVTDTHGNYMSISYINDSGAIYPAIITYTQRPGLSVFRTVEFNYETRPDQVVTYRYGVPITITKRLAYIDVKMNGNMIKRYELTYTSSTDSKESLLTSVREYGSDATALMETGTGLPPMTFSYL
ncbi:MAG: hypothetical protein L0Y56_00795, partial [Nitrospira sp.]|nr:hypothetical protein [Nitrospira sp.]